MSECKQTTVPIEKLVRDDRLRFRLPYSHLGEDAEQAVIERYKDVFAEYQGWGEFPPIVVVELTAAVELPGVKTERMERIGLKGSVTRYKPGDLILVGGFTRTLAAGLAGFSHAPAIVHQGSWEYAEELAWKENSRHGRRRHAEELGLVITAIRRRFPTTTLDAIAKLAGCTKSGVWHAEQRVKQAEAAREQAPEDSDNPGAAMQSKSSNTKANRDAVVRDLWGRPMPGPKVAEKFLPVPKIVTTVKKLNTVAADLCRLKHGADGTDSCTHPSLQSCDVAKAATIIHGAMEEIRDTIPWIICPQCDGDDAVQCETCDGRGWLFRPETEDLSPNLERKARKWIDERNMDIE